MTVSKHAEDSMEGEVSEAREKLPTDRRGITTKLEIYAETGGTHEGYIIANVDEQGRFKELFLKGFGKEGSTLDGWVNVTAMLFSIALQYRAEMPMIIRKLAHTKFEPYGRTNHPRIPKCRSVPDFVAWWLAATFGPPELYEEMCRIHRRLEAS